MKCSKALIPATLLMLWTSSGAQQAQQPARFSMKARLAEELKSSDGSKRFLPKDVWITAATSSQIRFSTDDDLLDFEDAPISQYASLFIFEPREYAEATALYRGRKYAEARAKFAEIKRRYDPVKRLAENPAALASFYEMECMRRAGDIAALVKTMASTAISKELRTVIGSNATRTRQMDLYLLWEVAEQKDWRRLDILAKELIAMTGDQRAQLGYLHGLALEGLGRNTDALNEFNVAMTADAGASHELVGKSALRVLSILSNDPDVKLAIKLWGSPDEKKGTRGHLLLQEAGSVAALYERILGSGESLPAQFKPLLRYKPEIAAPGADGPGKED